MGKGVASHISGLDGLYFRVVGVGIEVNEQVHTPTPSPLTSRNPTINGPVHKRSRDARSDNQRTHESP